MKEFLIILSSKPVKYIVLTICAIVAMREFRKIMGCLAQEKSIANGAARFLDNKEKSPLMNSLFNRVVKM